ncbi:NAD(FAD)-utilizing dehydrogenase [Pseudomonas sp. 1-7]|nr:NAD(FAD)-utilizing dehydrogenase [Pseudomonas sp. 1-7]
MTTDSPTTAHHVAIIGGGPAGLMAAEVLAQGGVRVELFDAMPSVGRKFLLAGVGGMNITHSESKDAFIGRYGERQAEIAALLREFDADALREWIHGLGIDTFVGTSGRVFPCDMKAAPLLRAWLRRLRELGVMIHTRSRWLGWNAELLQARGIEVAALKPSNCGFEVEGWSDHLREKFAGAPLKNVALSLPGQAPRMGEFVLTAGGIEGSLVYAFSADIRSAIEADGQAVIHLDLLPRMPLVKLLQALAKPRGKHSMAKHLHRQAGLDGVKAALLRELAPAAAFAEPAALASWIKALPITLLRPRPLDEAISSAGGVPFAALDEGLMLRSLPGVFCAGEMLDWEAPTGGYLLTACFASGRVAAQGLLDWLHAV